MGHWNYRIVEKDGYFGIHEAYYKKKKKKPHTISMDSMSPRGETIKELKKDLKWFKEAFKKPVLKYTDF